MKLLDLPDFHAATFGGHPLSSDMSPYLGMTYECACGEAHQFYPWVTKIIREIPIMKFVVVCPAGDVLTCVKIKGLFKPRFESLFGHIDKNT